MTRGSWAEHRNFIGARVLSRLAASAGTGLALGAIEIVFAFGLQAFLITIGVLSAESSALPAWLPPLRSGVVFSFIAAVGLARGLLMGLNYYFQGDALEEYLANIRSRLTSWALHGESASTSEITSLFNARVVGAGSAIYALQGLIVQAPIILLLTATLLHLSFVLTVSAIGALLLLAPPLVWLDRQINTISSASIADWDRANARLVMSIKNLLLIQIYGMESEEDARAQESLRRYRAGTNEHYALAAIKMAAPQVFGLIVVCLAALFARKNGLLAPGMLASYFYIFLRLVQTTSAANQAYSTFVFSHPNYDLLFAWWRRASTARHLIKPAPDSPTPGLTPGTIGWSLEEVSFTYPGAKAPALNGLTFRLEPGRTIVVTGASGTGKSTLVGLMLGNLEPTAGAITTLFETGGPRPLHACRSHLLRRVGYVGPESFLLEGTVRENLTYGLSHEPSLADLDEAERLAECGFLAELPDGREHRLTEQGQGLSAGQKQRLALARALLRKPTVLILDEATSNLDMETEARLVDTLERLKGSMTIVAVTHRRELLRIADQHLELVTA